MAPILSAPMHTAPGKQSGACCCWQARQEPAQPGAGPGPGAAAVYGCLHLHWAGCHLRHTAHLRPHHLRPCGATVPAAPPSGGRTGPFGYLPPTSHLPRLSFLVFSSCCFRLLAKGKPQSGRCAGPAWCNTAVSTSWPVSLRPLIFLTVFGLVVCFAL